VVTEQEIKAAVSLSAERQFDAALALYQTMLPRANEVHTRMAVLYGIVTCSTWLNLDQMRENAIQELKQLPDYEVSEAWVVIAQATAYADFGRAQEALDLINRNLKREVLDRDDFLDWKYEHLFYKGHCLVQLARCEDALVAFDAAHRICPEGDFETDMLIDQSNCFLALARYDEAYAAASQVLGRGDEEM
jgi:tetratricopeptide (TPR) repeat protein